MFSVDQTCSVTEGRMMKKSYYHRVDSEVPLTDLTLAELWKSSLRNDPEPLITWARPYEQFQLSEIYEQVGNTTNK